ncbi:MAG: hypothetical protein WCJ26_13675 [bacterium]
MKKYFFLLLLSLPLLAPAQAMIGLTIEELRKEFPSDTMIMERNEKGQLFTTFNQEGFASVYHFDDVTLKAYEAMLVPWNDKCYKMMIKVFDTLFTATPDSTWLSVNDGLKLVVTRGYDKKNNLPFFLCKEREM